MKYSEQILENAIPAEVASAAKDLSVRFESLKSVKIPHIGNSLEMFFIPYDSQLLSLEDGNSKNILGKIEVTGKIVGECYLLSAMEQICVDILIIHSCMIKPDKIKYIILYTAE